jgi:hypothetical protein
LTDGVPEAHAVGDENVRLDRSDGRRQDDRDKECPMSRIGRLGLALVVVLGCSPPSATSESSTARPDRNVISLAEIQAVRTDNAYELVRTLRPIWLRKRGSNSVHYDGDIVVYLNETRIGGPEALRQVEAISITSIRYYDPGAANFRYGSGHQHGAIRVSTQPAVERPTG